MRILKYIFLLFLLASFAFGVFVSTQKGDYAVSESKIIDSKKEIIYSYIKDPKNWKKINSWETNSTTVYSIPKSKTNNFTKVIWRNDDFKAEIETISSIENQKISQQIQFEESINKIDWILKDTLGKTKITISSKGVLPFGMKVYNYINGGSKKVIGNLLNQSLTKLDKVLKVPVIEVPKEIVVQKPKDSIVKNPALIDSLPNDLFEIKVDTIVSKVGTYYAAYTLNSTLTNIQKNFKIITPKIEAYILKNRFVKTGKPFLIFNGHNNKNDFANLSIGIPVAKNYVTKPESEIVIKKYTTYQALKVVLTGNTTHLDQTYDEVETYMKANKLMTDTIHSKIELYNKSILGTQNPQEWETVIYIPVTKKKGSIKLPFTKKKAKSNTAKLYPDNPTSTSEEPKPETPKKQEEVPNYEGDN